MTFLRLLIALSLAAPLTCQSEYNPYFALSTARTFSSSDEPSVNLTGINVQSVQMRVYRINNPLQFYSQLEDTHSFGTTNPRRSRKKSLLETLHDWKRNLRRNIRLDLRSQFTESPSAHFRQATPASNKGPQETYFADCSCPQPGTTGYDVPAAHRHHGPLEFQPSSYSCQGEGSVPD